MNKERAVEITVFLLRITSAIMFIQIGGLKLFGWFGGMPPGMELTTLVLTAGILEVFGGLAILLGLFTRPVAFILSGEMAIAYFIGHFSMGVWPIQNHGEQAVFFCFIFLFLAAYGAGAWSVDKCLQQRRNKSVVSDSPAV